MSEVNPRPVSWPILVVVVWACIVNYPCALWGLQSGDDHVVHLTYFHFFDQQLRSGELYPRWISGLNLGAGSPIFFVQYPLPYYAAACLRRVFHLPASPEGETSALGLFVFLTCILSGVFTWLWCRALTTPLAALCASIAYLTIPYVYSCDVYSRAAIGEYSALAWIPLALFCSHRLDIRPVNAVAGIASAFAMIVLSNLLTAFLFVPFLILYAMCRVNRTKMMTIGLLLGCGLLLGMGLSGVYFLPMVVHRRFFSMANLVRLGPDRFFYMDHLFPYGKSLFPGSRTRLKVLDFASCALGFAIAGILAVRYRTTARLVPRLLTAVATLCVLSTSCVPLLALAGVSLHPEVASSLVIEIRSRIFLISFLTLEMAFLAYVSIKRYVDPLPPFLVAASMACFLLATRWSALIWEHSPLLWNVQFPWRLEGLMSVFAAGLFALAFRGIWELTPRARRAMSITFAGLSLLVACSGVVVFDTSGSYVQRLPVRMLSKFETMYPAYASISAVPTSEELGAIGDLSNKVIFLAGDGTANLNTITARHLRIDANCLHSCTLLLKLVYYPFWRALDSSDASIPLRAATQAGLTELSLGPGVHEVNLELPRSRTEAYGGWLTLFCAAIVILLFLVGYPAKSPEMAAP